MMYVCGYTNYLYQKNKQTVYKYHISNNMPYDIVTSHAYGL